MNKLSVNNFFTQPMPEVMGFKFEKSTNPSRYIADSYDFEHASEDVQNSKRWLTVIAKSTNTEPSVVVSVTYVDDTYYVFSEIEKEYRYRNLDMKEVYSEDELFEYTLELLQHADADEVEKVVEYK